MSWLKDIEPGPKVPEVLNVIIEIPKGAQNKYEYDKKNNIIKLDRVLFTPFHFPGDYGFVPQTLCDDGDPLDALLIVTEPSFPGVLIEARPVALMKMIDSGEGDDKLLCVPAEDPRFDHIKDLNDVPPHMLKEIKHFYENYKTLQGKKVEVKEWLDSKAAKKVVHEAIELYKK